MQSHLSVAKVLEFLKCTLLGMIWRQDHLWESVLLFHHPAVWGPGIKLTSSSLVQVPSPAEPSPWPGEC